MDLQAIAGLKNIPVSVQAESTAVRRKQRLFFCSVRHLLTVDGLLEPDTRAANGWEFNTHGM